MVKKSSNIFQVTFKDMDGLADVIADLNNMGYDLIHNAKDNYWLIVNPKQTEKFVIESDYKNISEIRDLAGKELLFLLEE